MSEKHSKVNRRRWRAVPKEKRSALMSEIASKRMKKLTPAERLKLGKRLTKARMAKHKQGV